MLVLNAVKKLFSHQVKHLRHHKMKEKASKLHSMGRDVNDMMVEDLLMITATAMYAVMTALWTQDPSGLKIRDRYKAQRPAFTTDPNNRMRNLADLSGLCIGFNFKFDGCNNPDCPYLHICAFHPTEQLQHPSMRCNKNPNRWKNKRNNNNNYNNSRKRGGEATNTITTITTIITSTIITIRVIHHLTRISLNKCHHIHHTNLHNLHQINIHQIHQIIPMLPMKIDSLMDLKNKINFKLYFSYYLP